MSFKNHCWIKSVCLLCSTNFLLAWLSIGNFELVSWRRILLTLGDCPTLQYHACQKSTFLSSHSAVELQWSYLFSWTLKLVWTHESLNSSLLMLCFPYWWNFWKCPKTRKSKDTMCGGLMTFTINMVATNIQKRFYFLLWTDIYYTTLCTLL